jgi:hypothetical protein
MRKKTGKTVDRLPELLEAAHRALLEHLIRQPFSTPAVEEKVADMWMSISWARSDALRKQIKGHAREMGLR